MGTTVANGVVLDKGAVTTAAKQLSDTAVELRTAAKLVPSPSWGSGMNGADYEAGRAHLDMGKRIAAEIDRVTVWLRIWTTAVEDTAGAIGQSAVELVSVDDKNARATKQVAAQVPGQ
ncbi:hypothetical protein ACGFIX_01150 [Nocardia salmonicida]|uniref:hypothetical protein n=1 Tax=Nocardia salmonicida TaxID=53431 RepID=UPI0037240446